MRRTPMIAWVGLCTVMLAAFAATAQEKGAEKKGGAADRPAAEKGTRDARVKALMEEMRKVQQALAEEGVGAIPGGPPDPKALQQRMSDEQKRMEEMIRQTMRRQPPVPPEGAPIGVPVPGGPGDPRDQALMQMKQFLQNIDTLGGPGMMPGMPGMPGGGHDPLEIGQKMVMAGLEFQLKGLASRVNATTDKDAKEKLLADLRETCEKVVEGRRKHRARMIKELEARLADLKKQDDKDESTDALVKRLLEDEAAEKQADE
ncbi:MAG: hypothetical protein ACKV0T_00505 [Planctomycetales bacterium]